ncbi:MAG: glycosyltransferase family 2 protein [Clostridia bacterium]
MNKISIIVPIFNSEKYLKKCLDSIVNQTLKDIEIILIDDGSTDNSLEIVKQYSNLYNNIKYCSKKNEGQAVARNLGIEMASGEFIAFVDSDDYVELNMFESLYNNAVSSASDIVVCDYVEEYENKTINKKSLYIEADNLQKAYIVSVAGPCSKIIRADIFKQNNLKFLENNIYEDLAIIPSLALYSKKITYCEEIFYHYVIRENSTMQQINYNQKLESIFNVMDFLSKQFEDSNFSEELEFLYINHLLYAGCGRFLKYKNTQNMIIKIIDIMNSKYPLWKENKYLKNQSSIYKLTCKIFMRNNKFELFLYKILKKFRRQN